MNNNLHVVLKELRGKKTQEELAKEWNITQRTYSNYETGKRQPNIDMLIFIADYYHTSIDYLVGRYRK